MKNTIRNVILVLAMVAVAIMCVGIFLYDYIPTGLTVSNANKYETEATTTELLSDVKEAQSLLNNQGNGSGSTSTMPSSVKTNIVLKEYDISKTDLAIYSQRGDYKSGKADPFAEVSSSNSNSSNTSTVGDSGTNGTASVSESTTISAQNTTASPQSDGTFYNSSRQK